MFLNKAHLWTSIPPRTYMYGACSLLFRLDIFAGLNLLLDLLLLVCPLAHLLGIGLLPGDALGHTSWKPKVAELYITWLGNQNVRTFDVSMHNVRFMQIWDWAKKGVQDLQKMLLIERLLLWFEQLIKVHIHELKHQAQCLTPLLLRIYNIYQLCYKSTLQLLKKLDLSEHLDGIVLSRTLVLEYL